MKKSGELAGRSRPHSANGAGAASASTRGRLAAARSRAFKHPKTNIEAIVERYVDLFDFAPIAYVNFDRVGRIGEINLAAAKLLDRSRARLIGQPFALCVAREHATRFLEHLLLCRSGRLRVETTLNLKCHSGELIPVTLSSTPTASFTQNGTRLYHTAILDLRERIKAESELRQSKERYQTLFDSVPVAVYACDANGFIREFNQHAVELWGRQPAGNGARERFCGSAAIFFPDGRPMPHTVCPMARALRGEKLKAEELEILVERPDGTRRHVIATPTPFLDGRGRIVGAINSLYDITPLRSAETELRERKNELDLIVNQTPFMLLRCSRDLRYRYVSRRVAEVLGRAAPEIVGKRIVEIIGAKAFRLIRPFIKRVLSGETVTFENEMFNPAGEPRFFRATYVPDRDERGQIVGWISSGLEITGQKRAEEQLRESEGLHRALVSQTVVGMVRTNIKGQFVFVNRTFCKMLGYEESELLGKSLAQITHPEELAKTRQLFQRLARHGLAYRIEKRYQRKDGSYIWVIVSASPLRDKGGRTLASVAAVIDIGERKQAEAALEEANLLLESRVSERTRELVAANQELQNQIALRRRLEGELLEISEREQRRLGQELHDSLCQHLTAVAFMTRAVSLRLRDHRVIEFNDLDKIAELINEGVTEARTIARGLYPVAMGSAGLVPAIQGLVNQRTLPVRTRLEANDEIAVPDAAVALHLYRIVHEAIINANKHAHAREIVVKMRNPRGRKRELLLTITDDGVGVNPDSLASGGMGVQMMKYRAEAIGAQLQIERVKPHGTRIVCRTPL